MIQDDKTVRKPRDQNAQPRSPTVIEGDDTPLPLDRYDTPQYKVGADGLIHLQPRIPTHREKLASFTVLFFDETMSEHSRSRISEQHNIADAQARCIYRFDDEDI
ncbi:MAG: hypothetical protein JXA93_23450, partial [Anaerolineae bacterium]|nr:hypothetical protein [Anaerolineae bacterium]